MNGSAEDSCADVGSGDLKLRFHGHKIVREFALVRTNRAKGKDWLLIKKKTLPFREGWDRKPTHAAYCKGQGYLFDPKAQ